MVMNDTLSNALSRISQFEKLGRSECVVSPGSKTIAEVLGLLKKFNYIKGYEKKHEGNKVSFVVKLSGRINNCGVIKPRLSVKSMNFEKFEKRHLPSKDMGIMIVSTVEGMLDHSKAKEKKIGGKLIAYCY